MKDTKDEDDVTIIGDYNLTGANWLNAEEGCTWKILKGYLKPEQLDMN